MIYFFRFTFVLTAFLLLNACGTSLPSTFYILDNNPPPEKSVTLKNVDTVIIGIEPIIIPTYLDRPQIVVRDAKTSTVTISEFQRWAEHIGDVLPRVIGDSISERAGYPLAKQMNFNRDLFQYRLYIEVLRFDAAPDNEAVMDAFWTLTDPQGTVVYRTRSVLVEPVTNTYPDLVKAEQKVVKQLGYTIADYYIKNLQKKAK